MNERARFAGHGDKREIKTMPTWFSKNLGDAMFASESMHRIEALFLAAYVQAGRPKAMALFFRHESEGRLHCEVKAYFSPAAAAVARKLGAAPCPLPSPHGLNLSVGAEESWALLFPDRGR